MIPVLRITLGVVFLVIGIIGGFIPILQGWIFILLAIAMFFPNHRKVEEAMRKAELRLPRLVAMMRKMGIGHVNRHVPVREEVPFERRDDADDRN